MPKTLFQNFLQILVIYVMTTHSCYAVEPIKPIDTASPIFIQIRYSGSTCNETPTEKNQESLAEITNAIMIDEKCPNVKSSIEGESSHYGVNDGTGGRTGFCGEKFNPKEQTIAFPAGKVARPGKEPEPGQVRCGTMVRITNTHNGEVAYARVMDTGGFAKYDRIIDSSYGVAKTLKFANQGTANVKVDVCSEN